MSRIGTPKPLLVFAKAPRPGAVKTRLIPLLGPEGAARLHARLIKHTLVHASAAAPDGLELHTDDIGDPFLRRCAECYSAELVPQYGSGLGERMRNAFELVLSKEGCSSAVMIGADCPGLTAWHLRVARQALDEGNEAVVAPAEDGGYVLIGLTRLAPCLFEPIAWGTGDVMEQTRAGFRSLGWRWLELETLWDVDLPNDYDRLVKSNLIDTASNKRCIR